jgi:glycosyltransferase involved in cell wall biosynthesis
MSAVTHENVSWLLKGYHFLVAPSLWLETGPLVVLEAHAAGIPVIGSQRGGLAELLQHGVNGMLVEADSVQSWASQLERLCHDRELLVQLRKGIGMPRSMKTVAQEVAGFYQHILQEMKETA